jgi:hypothetical protein
MRYPDPGRFFEVRRADRRIDLSLESIRLFIGRDAVFIRNDSVF